jgi:hypothetical protein
MPMQPLSRVIPPTTGLDLHFVVSDAMAQRPKLAVLIVETIGIWAQVECSLGVILAVILETEAQTGLAMFLSLTSSNNQMAIVSSAAKAKLTVADEELFSAIMKLVRTAAKDRHKFAHWCWAYTARLPDALLLIDPAHQAPWLANLLGYHDVFTSIDNSNIFVLREQDAQEAFRPGRWGGLLVGQLLSVFVQKDRGIRAELRQTLSNEPPILEALSRLRQERKSNP